MAAQTVGAVVAENNGRGARCGRVARDNPFGINRSERGDWLVSDQLADAFRMEEQAGLKLATQARLVALRFRTYGDQVWEPPACRPIYNPMTKSVRD